MWNNFEVKNSVSNKFNESPDYYPINTSYQDEKLNKLRESILYNQRKYNPLGVMGSTEIIFNGQKLIEIDDSIDWLWSEILNVIQNFSQTNERVVGDCLGIPIILEPMNNPQLVSFSINDKRMTPNCELFFDIFLEEAQKLFKFLDDLHLGGNYNYHNQLTQIEKIRDLRCYN